MTDDRELYDAAIALLGAGALTRDELRTAVSAGGFDLGEPNEYGRDLLDRALNTDGTIEELGDDRVAHTPTVLRDVSITFRVTEHDAARHTVLADAIDPLVLWIIASHPRLVDGDGHALGDLDYEEEVDDELHEGRVIVGPPGWLDALVGRHGALTIVDFDTARLDALDETPPVTAAHTAAMQRAFDRVSDEEILSSIADEISVRRSFLSPILVEMTVTDPDVVGDCLPLIDVLLDQSGLDYDGFEVVAAGTDWDALHADRLITRLRSARGFDQEQAQLYLLLVGAGPMVTEIGIDALGNDAEQQLAALTMLANGLDDAQVAEQAWEEWLDDQQAGEPLQPIVDALFETFGDERPGVSWLRARQLAFLLHTDAAVEVLGHHRGSGHVGVLVDLAAIAADRSDPIEAQRLLRSAGVGTNIDLDDFDPLTRTDSFGVEIAEEVAPFAGLRPKATARRNDPCPCGSGRKYRQCHLGRETLELEDRAGWLYLKMIRFLGLTRPSLPGAVLDDMLDNVDSWDIADALEESVLPLDIALHEGGVAEMFLAAKASLLPADELALAGKWDAATRSVLRVERSTRDELRVIDLATNSPRTIRHTLPEFPITVGSLICGRLLPVGDAYRTYGGILPVEEWLVDDLLTACATRELEAVSVTLSRVFEDADVDDDVEFGFDDS